MAETILIVPTHGGLARLSKPWWFGEISRWYTCKWSPIPVLTRPIIIIIIIIENVCSQYSTIHTFLRGFKKIIIIIIIIHMPVKCHPSKWSCISQFQPTWPLPLHTSSLTPFHHVTPSQTGERTAVKEEEWRESTFHEVQRFRGRMPFLSPTSAIDIHWNSSFLQPPTDSRCSFTSALSVRCINQHNLYIFHWTSICKHSTCCSNSVCLSVS